MCVDELALRGEESERGRGGTQSRASGRAKGWGEERVQVVVGGRQCLQGG